MTREQLESYRSMSEEISELNEKLKNLAEEMTDNSTIFDYKTGFPRPQAVIGIDEQRYHNRKKIYQNHIEYLQRSCDEIEEFVEGIQDSLTRRIFRMTYLEGKTMEAVGRKVGLDRSSVSRRIEKYLKVAHKTTNTRL